jgi:serine/threonine protein phosphatase PrpC
MSGLRLVWAAGSDPGRVRANNQDAASAEQALFVVADGMGGHAAGEVASRVAIESMREHIGGGTLVDAVRLANRAVFDQASDDPTLRGMGTTLVAIALVEDPDGTTRMHVVNVGDSRVYLLRDGELEQITDDHSLVAELEREGRLTAEEARVHPQRNIVTRVLGNSPEVDVDEFPVDPFRGDRFVLCSDGLFNEVPDDEIASVLRHEHDPQRAVDELVRRANAAGGRDNITVVVVDVVDDGDKARQASAALAGSALTAAPAPVVATPPPEDSGHADRPSGAVSVTRTGEGRGKRRRVTWRAAAFTVALLLVIGAAAGSVWWFARGTYYVGFDGENVAIFKGRPGGVLWLDPTVERRYRELTRDDVQPARVADLEEGKTEPSLADAQAYIRRILTPTTTTTTTSTTTTSTTTTSTTTTTTAP